MKLNFRKKLGFTLMEVNLAVFIMAAGVLAMISLYPLGYRENQQSVDDVKAAACADAVFNQIAGVLSARNLTWSEWKSRVDEAVGVTGAKLGQSGGWVKFCKTGQGYAPESKSQINSYSSKVFKALTKGATGTAWPADNDLVVALVAQRGIAHLTDERQGEDYSRVVLTMRVSRNSGSLFAQPIFLTEIHFQGDQKENE